MASNGQETQNRQIFDCSTTSISDFDQDSRRHWRRASGTKMSTKVIVIDVESLDENGDEKRELENTPCVVDDTHIDNINTDCIKNAAAGDDDECDVGKTTDQTQQTPTSQQQQQQERNGSFKFSTTTYCGTCKKVLEDDFIGQCNDCIPTTTNITGATKNDKENTLKYSIDCSNLDNATCLQQLAVGVELSCDGVSQQPASPAKSMLSERTCRICLDSIDQGDIIAPCKCSGSTKYAHESCLLKWFFKSSKKSCEVCLGNVNVKPVGYKPVQEWRLPESGCDFIVYLFGLYFLIMVIFTGMITWIATQGCISPVCVTLYCVCAIAVFYFFYCCGCVEYSRRYWKALLSVNKIWRIYGRADSLKNFKHNVKRGGDAPALPTPPTGVPLAVQTKQDYVIDVEPRVAETNNKEEVCIKKNVSRTPSIGVDNFAMEIDDVNVTES